MSDRELVAAIVSLALITGRTAPPYNPRRKSTSKPDKRAKIKAARKQKGRKP